MRCLLLLLSRPRCCSALGLNSANTPSITRHHRTRAYFAPCFFSTFRRKVVQPGPRSRSNVIAYSNHLQSTISQTNVSRPRYYKSKNHHQTSWINSGTGRQLCQPLEHQKSAQDVRTSSLRELQRRKRFAAAMRSLQVRLVLRQSLPEITLEGPQAELCLSSARSRRVHVSNSDRAAVPGVRTRQKPFHIYQQQQVPPRPF
jgi:hypothetical protein